MNVRHASADVARAFYDGFLKSRMLSYRLYGSPRIRAATRLLHSYVHATSRVLEIGCGIGMISESLAAKARGGRVWACDLSEANIWFARETVSRANAEFFVCDVLDDFDTLRSRIDGPVDIVALVDVIEHLPTPRHEELFTRLRQLCHDRTVLVLTFPTPAYQRYLAQHLPEELQPIDEVIETSDLLHTAGLAGFRLEFFETVNLDRTGQYVHCVFRSSDLCEPIVPGAGARLRSVLRGFADRYVLVPVRRRRYVTRVLARYPADHDT